MRTSDAVSRTSLALCIALGLAACAHKKPGERDDAPTLKSLESRHVLVAPDAGIPAGEDKAIAAYKNFLAAAPQARQRAEAMRRLGDLEMDSADNKSDASPNSNGPDYRVAVAHYQDFLKAHPNDANRDRVLYQLARAYEQGGDLDASLTTLDRLVHDHPSTAFADEAQFRRGELLFSARDYPKAEAAYATVLKHGKRTLYRERALYMQGWAIFKQGRLDDALNSFFGVLDLKVANRDDTEFDSPAGLSRADRELVEDTFRVTSLCLENLQGADSIPAYMTTDTRRSYEYRVYQQLGELYIKQERTKDAADTFGLFARSNPLHAQAPVLQARVIEIYQQAGFGNQALNAKKEYVERYGIASEFRRANPQGWERAQPLVKTHLTELARIHHAAAQKSKRSEDYHEAVRWYRAYISSFPTDADTPQNNFLLAELLREDARYAEAAVEYEKTAYDYPAHAKSADAGYDALLSYAAQEKRNPPDTTALQRTGVESALHFAKAFPSDPRTGPVLSNAAERLYALHDGERAATVAKEVLQVNPAAAAAHRRVAWTVVAHTAFERGAFKEAEQAYAEVVALTPDNDPARRDLVERLAASVYKQGEQARASGNAADAVAAFNRVASVAPQSPVRATAQYDAAAALIGMKDWDGATRTLEDFRQRYPHHPLQDEVTSKLTVVYLERQQWAQAAAEFERLSAGKKDPQLARDALWQSAELYEKADSRAAAARVYERYLKQNPEPFERAVEARSRLARIAKADGNGARRLALMREIFQADQHGGTARTARTRYLGAMAALALAEPSFETYRKVPLVEPLARQLKLKKARMEEVLKAYAVASDYGVADAVTAATHQTAALYQDFGHALMTSERPRKLNKAEREQYDVMLEEQAFPFEEKAIALHEVNAQRAAQGIYDEWVQASFKALGQLRPVRYGKNERSDSAADAGIDIAATQIDKLPEAVTGLEKAAGEKTPRVTTLNQLGIAYRRMGQFAKARDAYERAIAIDGGYAAPLLNLGILNDLYLGDSASALALYERYLALAPNGDATVSKWVVDLKNRKAAPPQKQQAALARKEQP